MPSISTEFPDIHVEHGPGAAGSGIKTDTDLVPAFAVRGHDANEEDSAVDVARPGQVLLEQAREAQGHVLVGREVARLPRRSDLDQSQARQGLRWMPPQQLLAQAAHLGLCFAVLVPLRLAQPPVQLGRYLVETISSFSVTELSPDEVRGPMLSQLRPELAKLPV